MIVEHSIHQLDVVGHADGFHQNSVRIERSKLLDAVSRNQKDTEMSAGFGLKEDITEIEVKSIETEGDEGFSSNAMLEKHSSPDRMERRRSYALDETTWSDCTEQRDKQC